VEGVGRIGRVGERPENVEELDDRPRPAVAEHERQGVRVPRAGVDEVDALPVDLRQEVVQPVETVLLRPPVEALEPVTHQLAEVGEVGSLLPAGLRRRARPPRPRESLAQVLEVLVGDVNVERLDLRSVRHHAPEAPQSPTSVA
jgi:hypothetical protein